MIIAATAEAPGGVGYEPAPFAGGLAHLEARSHHVFVGGSVSL